MVDKDIVEKLSVTRAKLEAVMTGSAVIAVTSARVSDGAELLAHGLAMSLASVTRDVLLLGLPASTRIRGNDRIGFRDARDGVPTVSNLAPAYSFEAAQLAFEDYRRHYRFTVVSTVRPTQNGSMLSLIGAADFVVIGVEEGRPSKPEDKELAEALRSANANVLGVVTIDRKAIRRYGAESGAAREIPDLRFSEEPHPVGRAMRFDREESTVPRGPRASLIS